ncbi:LINE-1 type transposase domain-containing protein 1 [Labeo rohita]|uniref:LINE-1 type transposase domain-containing protein 1 n=1 Tax=Labeo rohita TaxID=84645 RepID=A0ABQ8LJ41_LABRO|nr:LINE-1 type transposase domain-containing protein 1 [Labeo rohita]
METASVESFATSDNLKVHNYARRLENAFGNSPDTPSKSPAQKKSRSVSPDAVSNSVLLAAIEKVSKLQEESLVKLQSVKASVKENTSSICKLTCSLEAMNRQVEDVTEKVLSLHYKRRWNLRVARIPEREGENVKMVVIELFRSLSPLSAEKLQDMVDIAHRLGPKSGNSNPQRIIVQFLSRTCRDAIWTEAKRSELLKQKKIRILEDLTQDDKEVRNRLWPLVEKARREGKKAGFHGSVAFINGKKVSVHDI